MELPNIKLLLDGICNQHVNRLSPFKKTDAVLGGSNTLEASKHRKWAYTRGIPYIALGDGFFCSNGLPSSRNPQVSFVVDDFGIYSEYCGKSSLDKMLAQDIVLDAQTEERVQKLLSFVSERKLTQHQLVYGEVPSWLSGGDKEYALLTDSDDFMPLRGRRGLTELDFNKMLSVALTTHSPDRIIIKTQSDALKSRNLRCFSLLSLPKGIKFLCNEVDPWVLFNHVSIIHTSSDYLGFEALLAGREVHCHKQSFYSGRGLTRDYYDHNSGGQKCSFLSFINAVLIKYPIYLDPFGKKLCTPEKGLEIISDLKERSKGLKEKKVVLGVANWKIPSMQSFVGSTSKKDFVKNRKTAFLQCVTEGVPLYSWASFTDDDFAHKVTSAGIKLVRIEDGFIRSVGLGVNLIPACSLVFDPVGIYYDSRRPSLLEDCLNENNFSDDDIIRAKKLREKIIESQLTKYNAASEKSANNFFLPKDRTVVLVAGQVEDDASILCSTPKLKTNLELLKSVRTERPDAYIIYKPHPDIVSGLRKGKIFTELAENYTDHIETAMSVDDLLAKVDEVHTLTSLIGFEALIRGLKVVVYGLPFYAGWGLTEDKCLIERRRSKLSIDQLVAGALLRYPSYIDPVSGLLCEPELLIDRLTNNKNLEGSKEIKEYLRRLSTRTAFMRMLRRNF